MSRIRSTAVSVVLAAIGLLVGCSIPGFGDCDLRPVETSGGVRLGPPVAAAASCAQQVEVEGRTYFVSVGRWLDVDSVVVQPYAAIDRSNAPVEEPTAFALDGVDPAEILLMRDTSADDLGPLGPWMVLESGSGGLPESICRYADHDHPQIPETCGGTEE